MSALRGRVALVTGASRGVGRGMHLSGRWRVAAEVAAAAYGVADGHGHLPASNRPVILGEPVPPEVSAFPAGVPRRTVRPWARTPRTARGRWTGRRRPTSSSAAGTTRPASGGCPHR